MHSRGSHLRARLSPGVILALVFVGCGGGGGDATGPDDDEDDSGQTVVSVEVSPDTATASELGATVQFEAEGEDESGNTVSGTSFSWSSSISSVATIDDQGLATAQDNGATTLQATASGVTGSAYLTVRAGELAWRSIRAGNIFSCGLTTHGTAYCWGDNVHGELGDGNTTQTQLTPVKVRARLYFEQLTLGGGHTCALGFDNAAYCWGNSFVGEGGYGETTGTQTDPVQVSGGFAFRHLAASGNHTCGVTLDDVAYCWGRNANGQLGDGTTEDRTRPVQVSGGLSFARVAVGPASIDNHSCGVTTGGTAYCWGVNGDGEIGDGSTEERHEPAQVQGGLTFTQVTPGGRHSCGLTNAGTAYCWGGNSQGQLGDGTTETRLTPVEVSGDHQYELITAGEFHTCGLATDGTAYCWGNNSDGRLGDGTTENQLAPVEVTGGLTFRQLEAGAEHTCGVTTSDTGYCWGKGDNARLGNGIREAEIEPFALPDPGELD